jgi:hypothetical protein
MAGPLHGDSTESNVPAVEGTNTANGTGVSGVSNGFDGVNGRSLSPAHAGVAGINDSGGFGVFGRSNTGMGVHGESDGFDGVHGTSGSSAHAGVAGINDSGGFGVFGRGTPAGRFVGTVEVTGEILLVNADCAEEFEIVEAKESEPGTVMVLNQEGMMRPSYQAYDKRVAGVISGAGDLKPGIVLGKQPSQDKRRPIALLGKVNCKVDAECSSIEVGDLLTTSPTPGHAMRADDPVKAFGSVIGKALRPLQAGQGMIPILIALQ